nr:reverse transcriptase domain-containing protein [Tanacetum cinerariifolium]
MRTRSSSNLHVVSPNPSTSNPKHHNRRRSKQPFILEESPVDTMADQRTMTELLRAPTEGFVEAIVVPPILAEQFELKHSLINMMTSDQFFGLEKDNPHDHIRWFNKITSTIKYKDVPNSAIKLMLFPFSLAGAARRRLKKEPSRSIHTWEDLVSKFINEFFPPSRTTNLRNEIFNFQQRFDELFHEAWDRYKDLLHQDSLNAAVGSNLLERRTQDVLTIIENKSKVRNSQNKSVVSQVKSCDANSNSSSEIAKLIHAVNQQTSDVTTSITVILKQFQATPPPASVKAEICVTCGGARPYYQCLDAGGNTFPELQDNIQGYVSAAAVNYNQGNSVYSPPGSGSLPSNTVSNPKGELKAITTRSGLVLDGPTVPTPRPFINPEEDERVEETLTNPDLSEYTIKYQKMLKALLYNKEKLQELANTPLNEICSAVILKKLPEKLGDPGKFLIPCGFSELKCKALADLGASINLMPLFVWKKLGLPELISTRMTLKLANQAICTPAGIERDVFIPIGKFTFPADFVIVDYESDPRVPLILGRPFLQTTRALIDVHGEEMILRDGDERLTLNTRHETSSYSNQLQKESINLINVFNNSSEDFLEDLFSNQPSGNPTFSSHPELTSPEVKDDIFDSEGGNVLPEILLDLDATKDLHPPLHFDVESDLKEIEFLLHQDIDSSLKDSIDQIESDAENVYDDPFDSKGEKIKESKLLIDELDLPCDFLLPFEYKSFIFQDFSRVDALPSTNNEDKVFNPGILIEEKPFEIITRIVQDKKLAISNASSIIKDFDPPLYEPLFFKEVPRSNMLLSFSSKNEEKVFKPGIHTSEKVHSSRIPELSHQGYKVFKINQICKSPMKFYFLLWKGHPHLGCSLSLLLPH